MLETKIFMMILFILIFKNGVRPLHVSASARHVDIVAFLISTNIVELGIENDIADSNQP